MRDSLYDDVGGTLCTEQDVVELDNSVGTDVDKVF